jgi:predicted metal-dependent phosphoesterase TrpH
MHIHTNHSKKCGYMDAEEMIKQAINRGLDGVAVTDHNTIEGALEAERIVKDQNLKLQIIIGEEINTNRGEVLAYFIDSTIEEGPIGQVLKDIEKAGGLSALSHPFDRIRKGFSNIEDVIDRVDAIEVLNSRCLFNGKALDICTRYNKAMIAGSDAHFCREIGNAWTSFADDPRLCMERGRTAIGGGISNPMYLALTKGIKLWRRATSG